MILFGHLGLTLGAVRVIDSTIINRDNVGSIESDSSLEKIIKKIDYRYVLLGAILPDAVDKLIIFFYNDKSIRSGRYIGHSLFFALSLLIIGLFSKRVFRNSCVVILSVCSMIHLVLDKMWKQMSIFLWPFYDLLPKAITNQVPVWTPTLPEIPQGNRLNLV